MTAYGSTPESLQECQNRPQKAFLDIYNVKLPFFQTYNFIVGVSYYHDKEKLQLKQGLLMKQILAILKKRWKDWDKNLEIPNPKFIAYSTQDWMVMAFLDALGCGKPALSGTIPGYNSLVVIELVDRDGDPFIWVYFKDNSMDSLKDLTKAVRGCNSSPCPLEKFLKCCNDYVTDDPKQVCGQQWSCVWIPGRTYNFIVGVSYYHDKEKLQLKQGLLMKQILAILKKRWKDWDKNLEIPNPKFIAYSTQDWMVMAFLDALGCGKPALSGTIPGYNSLVVIELVDRDGDPFIWVYFKDNSMDSLKDLTKAVRGCNSSPCPLEKFLKCCNDYVTDDPKQVCGQQS
ncbi:hypothetical protein OSTOST_05848 [Ostertagia ostertagi]